MHCLLKTIPWQFNLLDQIVEDAVNLGRWVTILHWAQEIPEKYLVDHPVFCTVYASVLAPLGHLDESEKHLQLAEKKINTRKTLNENNHDVDSILMSSVITVRATIARMKEDYETGIQLSAEAIRLAPKYHVYWFTALSNLGHSYRLNGQMEEANQCYRQIIAAAQENKLNLSYLIMGMLYLAATKAIQGHLHEAAEIYHQALKKAEIYNVPQIPYLGIVKVGLGEIYREWNFDSEINLLFCEKV